MEKGIGPSTLSVWVQDRSLRLAAGLAIAVAIPVAVLFYFQLRSLSDLDRASTVVLRQLSQGTADSLTRSVVEALKSPYANVLLRVTQRQVEPLDLPVIETTFERSLATDTFITRYYVWSDETDVHRDEVIAYDRERHGFVADVPEAATLVSRVRAMAVQKRTVAIFETTIDGCRSYVQAQLRFSSGARDRLTSFVAIAADGDRLRNEYFPALLAAKLKTAGGPTGFPPLAVTLLDAQGSVIFPPGGAAPAHYLDERTFPMAFLDPELLAIAVPDVLETWRIRTGYGNQTIPEIMEARARPQRVMMSVVAIVMMFSLFFVVRAAAREVRLAELKSNFVSNVSHDLKTPLALIQLFAETLELGRLKNTERAQEYYRIINSEARKLTKLINNLLDFSRIEAGLRRYKTEAADLGEVTEHVVESLASQFSHHGFTVTTRIAADVPLVVMDREAAEQAIENLLSNAMKYSPDRRPIAVEVDAVDGYGVVRIIDQGVGIPEAQQRRIFRKFYRIQTDAGSGAQGTGLGLAIVDHIMRGHGGFVRVDSEPGRGSTFTLHFPVFKEAHDEADTGDRGRTADVARSA
jgi:signal transduction histidine kinase